MLRWDLEPYEHETSVMEKHEENLITEILAGDTDAFAILVRRYQRPIYNLMLRMTASEEDAFDLTQDAFIRAYEKLNRFRPSGRFFNWLYTIGINLARDHLRKTKIKKKAEEKLRRDNNPLHIDPEQEIHLPGELDPEQVRTSLEQLPFDYREAIFLRFHEGFSMKELATILGISVSGAKMRVHRGVLKLRQLLLGKKS